MRRRYFYDPSSKSFHDQCLHSELNEMKQRKRDRNHDEWMTVSEEAALELPSMVSKASWSEEQSVLRVMCSKLRHANPHERVVLGMFLSCVMEESWKEQWTVFSKHNIELKATPQLHILNLEASARSTTTSSLELATLRAHVGLRLATRSTGSTEVLHSVTVRAAALQEHGVGSSGSAESQLIERQALTSGLHDARTSSLREAQSAHLHRGNLNQAHVVRNGAHHHSDLAISALHVSRQRAQAHGRTVDSAHIETTKHHLRELSTRATSNEAVELRISEYSKKVEYLDQKSKIDVIALGSLSGLVSALATSSNQVNTLGVVRR